MRMLRTLCGIITSLTIVSSGLIGNWASHRVVSAQSLEREVFVSVLDEQRMPVSGLDVKDLIIREDGIRREVLRISPALTPLQLVILVDTSQAATAAIFDIRKSLQVFVEEMPEETDISVITFGGPPRILVETTRNHEILKAGINRIFSHSGTAAYLLDALADVAYGFQRRAVSRPTVIVVTTSGIDASNYHYSEVLDILSESRANMHALVLPAPREQQLTDESNLWLTRSALSERGFREFVGNQDITLTEGPKITGGRRIDLLTSMGLENALKAVAKELSNQYLVAYARPRMLIPPEEIKVDTIYENFSAHVTLARAEREE